MVWISALLLIVTAIYAGLTFAIAKETRAAAEASKASADSARAAAEASLRSALVAEAQLQVDFSIEINRHANGSVWFNVYSSVNIWVHAINVVGGIFVAKESLSKAFEANLEFSSDDDDHFPRFSHAGEGFTLEWPQPQYRIGDYGILGTASVHYSLNKDGEVRRRAVYFQSRSGLGRTALFAAGLLEPDDIDQGIGFVSEEN